MKEPEPADNVVHPEKGKEKHSSKKRKHSRSKSRKGKKSRKHRRRSRRSTSSSSSSRRSGGGKEAPHTEVPPPPPTAADSSSALPPSHDLVSQASASRAVTLIFGPQPAIQVKAEIQEPSGDPISALVTALPPTVPKVANEAASLLRECHHDVQALILREGFSMASGVASLQEEDI